MRHLRLLMELQSYAVSAEVADDAVMVFVGVLLDGVSYVAHEAIGLGCLHANLQTFLCHTHQLLLLWSGLADDEHARSVGVISVKDGGEVHVDDVALLKDVLLLGDAVADHLVDACADALRESLVVKACGDGSVRRAVVVAYLVYLERAHSGTYVLCHFVKHTRIDDTTSADALYLFRGLDERT